MNGTDLDHKSMHNIEKLNKIDYYHKKRNIFFSKIKTEFRLHLHIHNIVI